MNFINDFVTDEDCKRFDFSVFKKAPAFAFPLPQPVRWTVDRAAGVFLLKLGDAKSVNGNGDGFQNFEYFSLWWQGCDIECKLWSFRHTANAITWKRDWIAIPPEHIGKMSEIYAVLQQALKTYQYQDYFMASNQTGQKPMDDFRFDFNHHAA